MKDYFVCDAKFLKLDIPFPYKEMLAEAKALRHRFVEHRGGDAKGWYSLTLHGLGENKTGIWKEYGYPTSVSASDDMHWTPAADDSPVTKEFFLNHFPCKKYGRVRFMLLEAGGHIDMHSDGNMRLLENINMVLNNPNGCKWIWGDGEGSPPMTPGEMYAMNISYHHALVNNSDEDRYHLIVARHDATDEWKSLIEQSANEKNVEWSYKSINELP
jgi:Aspartyl/Asparaginyl beta-hydroxylase